MPGSPCFETPTLVAQLVALLSTRVARRILAKAAVRRRAGRARRTRGTVVQLPREQGGSAQGRSQATACDHHTVQSVNAITPHPVGGTTSWPDDTSRLSGPTSHGGANNAATVWKRRIWHQLTRIWISFVAAGTRASHPEVV